MTFFYCVTCGRFPESLAGVMDCTVSSATALRHNLCKHVRVIRTLVIRMSFSSCMCESLSLDHPLPERLPSFLSLLSLWSQVLLGHRNNGQALKGQWVRVVPKGEHQRGWSFWSQAAPHQPLWGQGTICHVRILPVGLPSTSPSDQTFLVGWLLAYNSELSHYAC